MPVNQIPEEMQPDLSIAGSFDGDYSD